MLIFVELIDHRFLKFIFITNSIVPTIYCRGLGAKNADRQKIYIKPYCRMGPYLVGMYTGYLLYKFNGKFRMNKVSTVYLDRGTWYLWYKFHGKFRMNKVSIFYLDRGTWYLWYKFHGKFRMNKVSIFYLCLRNLVFCIDLRGVVVVVW